MAETETLRPNAAGDECNINSQQGCSACPNHYDCVSEVVADDWTTVVKKSGAGYLRDLYAMANLAVSPASITSVVVWARADTTGGTGLALKICIKTGTGAGAPDTVDEAEKDIGSDWANYSHTWNTNPATGAAFTEAEVNAMQAGVAVQGPPTAPANTTAVTQVWMVVTYELPSGWSGKFIGVTDPAKVLGVAKANIAKVNGVA